MTNELDTISAYGYRAAIEQILTSYLGTAKDRSGDPRDQLKVDLVKLARSEIKTLKGVANATLSLLDGLLDAIAAHKQAVAELRKAHESLTPGNHDTGSS